MSKGNMQLRVVSLAALVAIVFLILVARLWQLQVLTSEGYTLSAHATQTREIKIPAQRGVIYDRNGNVLANNVPGLNVTVIPAMITRDQISKLADVLKADKSAVLSRYDAADVNPYEPILVKENADRNDIMYVSERTREFPGLSVNNDYVRNYPNGSLAAHVLGYTGAVTQAELKTKAFKGVSDDAVVGKSGVELTYEKALSGKPGSKVYNVDAFGRIVPKGAKLDSMGRFVDASGTDSNGVDPRMAQPNKVTEPVPGDDLTLTLDENLQKTAEKELDAAIQRAKDEGAEGSGGAVIAMNPKNGEILAMASRPDFNPQLFVGGISGSKELKTYNYLMSDKANSPFTNRAITGAYPGASTFKVFTGLAGLVYHVITPQTTYTDNGGCWRPTGVSDGCWYSWRQTTNNPYVTPNHGTQNYSEAITDSNDKFFYQVADWMWNQTSDPNKLPDFYKRFGFGSLTGIDIPGETAGRIPTKQWFWSYQKKYTPRKDWRDWSVADWVNMAIGQGDVLVSPIQMIRAYAAVENGGTLVTPHVGKEIRDQNGKLIKKIDPKPAGHVDIAPEYRDAMMKGFRGVVGPSGTASLAFQGAKLPFVGKSGTGEMPPHDPVNWFCGWVEHEKQPLVVVVMVEGGDESEVTAAPAVRNILEAYYGTKSTPAPSNKSLMKYYSTSDNSGTD